MIGYKAAIKDHSGNEIEVVISGEIRRRNRLVGIHCIDNNQKELRVDISDISWISFKGRGVIPELQDLELLEKGGAL